MTQVDLNPACLEAAELRKVYLQVIKGQSVKRVRYKNGEDERETDFSPANVQELKAVLRDAEERCRLGSGRARRSAISVGVLPRRTFGGGW